MSTYSIYNGTSHNTISSSLILVNSATQSYEFSNNNVYLNLLDNNNSSINPTHLRDSLLSIYDTFPFKITKAVNKSYIGIDNGDPNNKDLKSKIFLGKRYNTSNYVMSSVLLNSGVDLFLYNTKSDIVNNDSTKILLLSGRNTKIYKDAPYLQSIKYKNIINGDELSLDLVNPIGDISLLSKGLQRNDPGNQVSINNIIFPTYQGSDVNLPIAGSATDGSVLLYNDGKLSWNQLELPNNGFIGVTGTPVNIIGNPVNVNGYSLEMDTDMFVPIEFGGIKLASSLNNESLVKVLEKMIYTYLPPLCSLSTSKTYYEIGTYPDITLDYIIQKRTNNTLPTLLTNMIPNSYPSISTLEHSTIIGTASGIVILPIVKGTTTFKIKVNDGLVNNSSTSSISGIYPIFSGFSNLNSMTTFGLLDLKKDVDSYLSKSYSIFGVSNYYFIYDYAYGPLDSIINEDNGNNLLSTSQFEISTMFLSSPTGLWGFKEFYVYKKIALTQSSNDWGVRDNMIGYTFNFPN